MAKDRESVYKKFSMKDILVIILALLAVVALVVFLVIVQKKQQEAQKELVDQSTQQQEETKETEALVKAKSSLVINEVNGSGWIELYNKESAEAAVAGYQLLWNGEVAYSFTENDAIGANGWKVIDLSDFYAELTGSDVVALVSADGTYVDQLKIPVLDEKESYGRIKDGDIFFQYMEATKEVTNQEAPVIAKQFPVFSVPGGFYDTEFELTIEAEEGMKIFYTLDGSMPTLDSAVYTEPIPVKNINGQDNYHSMVLGVSNRVSYLPDDDIDKCVVVRAVAEAPDGTVSEIVSESYFIGHENVSLYQNMPVISLMIDPDSLFDYYDGIYVLGIDYENALAAELSTEGVANFYRGTKKDATIQYFEADKTLTYSSDVQVGIKVDYGTNLSQKSFLISEAMLPASKGSNLSSLLTGGEDATLVLNNGRLDIIYKFREYFIGNRLATITTGTRDIQPCLVFVDGEFWGLYQAYSQYTPSYLAKTYELKEEDILLAEDGLVNKEEKQSVYNELDQYVKNTDLSNADNYRKVTEMMDIQSYLDVYCANIYLGNSEFPLTPPTAFRTERIDNSEEASRFADGRWYFLLESMDDSLGLDELNNYSLNTFLRPQIAQDPFLYSLMRNEQFREQFRETMNRMKTVYFSFEPCTLALDEISSSFSKQIVANYQRFYGAAYEEMFLEMSESMSAFLENRSTYLDIYLEEFLALERAFIEPVADTPVATNEVTDITNNGAEGTVVEP